MTQSRKYTERFLDQEIDTIEICPWDRRYMIVGTYSLIKQPQVQRDDGNDEEASTTSSSERIGSLQILPVDVSLVKDQPPRLNFSCAILDVRFCPYDDTLLGAATSIGELRFFRVIRSPGESRSDVALPVIIPIGIVRVHDVGEDDEDNSPRPLITQFAWLSDSVFVIRSLNSDRHTTHYLTTCDTTGQARLVQVSIPSDHPTNEDKEINDTNNLLPCITQTIHKHMYDLEAWTISAVTLPTANKLHQVLFSGGDDSCLIASSYTLNLPLQNPLKSTSDGQVDTDLDFRSLPYRIHLDKHTHSAGVVSVLPLPAPFATSCTNDSETRIPILTGSYDQHLRLHYLDQTTLKTTPMTQSLDLELEGGVWRLILIDSYLEPTTNNQQIQNYILLISAMHAGCYIVRLTCTISDDGSWIWQSNIEVHFTAVHQSMVYACTAIAVTDQSNDLGKLEGKWRVISTSFYDKRICVWDWTDDVRSESST